jgi:hypothetical protein
MDWRETAAGRLPAPRDDEPATLRQDILDELADHLDCALARELSKNFTPEEAIANVKRRFGDPRDLARRLWVDAMKDTIMSKRLTLAAMALMTMMCLLSGWIAWSAHRASLEAAESITRANGALISQLSTLLAARPAPVAAAGPERADVHFRLICDDAQKSPAKGYEAKLYLAGSGSSLNPLQRTSDEHGSLDFGMLPAGSYMLRVTTPWHEFAQIPVEVSPAFPITSPIVCPAQDWQPADVEFEFDGLPSLKDRDALIVLYISAAPNRTVGTSYSWMHDGNGSQGQPSYDVVLDTSGHLIYFSEAADRNGSRRGFADMYGLPLLWGGTYAASGAVFQLLTSSDQFTWLADGLNQKPQLSFSDRRYEMSSITVLLAPDIRRMVGQALEPSRRPDTLQTWARDRTPVAKTQIFGPGTDASPLQPIPGRKNVWKVRLARNFADEVTKMLLSSASRLPDAKDAVKAEAETKVGSELLKTLGIASAVPERTADGLTGLRLGAIADNLPAKYAGFQEKDLLLGVNGWNVNNNRELGRAARGYPLSTGKSSNSAAPRDHEEPVPSNALVALVSRGTETLLYEVKPPGSPAPKPPASKKTGDDAKPTDQGVVPGRGFGGGRRRFGNP